MPKNLLAFVVLASSAVAMAGCVTQDTAASGGAVVVTSTPPQRSYLDPGPVPARRGEPNYVRDNLTSSPQQTDAFGNDLLPKVP